MTVVKTDSGYGPDSKHANQLVLVRGESSLVYSADGAYFHVYSFRNGGQVKWWYWQQLWKLWGFESNEIKCSKSGLSYSFNPAAK